MQDIIFRDLGRMEYKEAWDYQESLLKANLDVKSELRMLQESGPRPYVNEAGIALAIPTTRHYLLFVEHPPVYTLGKSGRMENLLLGENERKQNGVEFFPTNRGGDITYHGPGQIVGYPILDLEKYYTDIGKYLRRLEEVIILTLRSFGIESGRSPGETGVWLDPQIKGRERKICAMGVRCSRWITMHGFALNVNTDLSYFNNIIPCGIPDKQVTSMQKELGKELEIGEVKIALKSAFEKIFDGVLISG